LDELRADCASKGLTVLDDEPDIIEWHRAADFQLLSLKMIARGMLHCMPLYCDRAKPPKMFVPGEISLQTFEFRRHVSVYASESNPGASTIMLEFWAKYGEKNFSVVRDPPRRLQQISRRKSSKLARFSTIANRSKTSSALSVGIARCSSLFSRFSTQPNGRLAGRRNRTGSRASRQSNRRASILDQISHMLLYLNNKTFVGENGHNLAREVSIARSYGVEIILVHENDADRDGCTFSRLFQTTPHELIADGLYSKIAVACHPEPHREVSLAQVAKAFGAVRVQQTLLQAANKAATIISNAPRRTANLSPRRTSRSERYRSSRLSNLLRCCSSKSNQLDSQSRPAATSQTSNAESSASVQMVSQT